MDQEKAYDRVLREEWWCCMLKSGVAAVFEGDAGHVLGQQDKWMVLRWGLDYDRLTHDFKQVFL